MTQGGREERRAKFKTLRRGRDEAQEKRWDLTEGVRRGERERFNKEMCGLRRREEVIGKEGQGKA